MMAAEGLFSKFLPAELHMDATTHPHLEHVPSSVTSLNTTPSSENSEDDCKIEQEEDKHSLLPADNTETSNPIEINGHSDSPPLIIAEHPPTLSPGTSTPTKAVLDRFSVRSEECISPMLTDPTLPEGWSRRVTQRTMGASAGKYDVYIFSPDRKKIRSKTDLMLYLTRNNLSLNVDDFDFSVRGRANTPVKQRSQKIPRQRKPKITIPKKAMEPKIRAPKIAKAPKTAVKVNSNVAEGPTNAQSLAQASTGPKLVVKFNFPIARLKRSASMKTKNKSKAKKIRRQESQTSDTQESQTSENSHTSNSNLQFECHEELSNGETRLTNGFGYGSDEDLA